MQGQAEGRTKSWNSELEGIAWSREAKETAIHASFPSNQWFSVFLLPCIEGLCSCISDTPRGAAKFSLSSIVFDRVPPREKREKTQFQLWWCILRGWGASREHQQEIMFFRMCSPLNMKDFVTFSSRLCTWQIWKSLKILTYQYDKCLRCQNGTNQQFGDQNWGVWRPF